MILDKNRKICENCSEICSKHVPITDTLYLACTKADNKWIFEIDTCPLNKWHNKGDKNGKKEK